MKLAVLSESSADAAALRILVEGILGRPTEHVGLDHFAARSSWPGTQRILPVVLKHLHYQTDAEALVVVVDSDKSPVHQAAHEQPGGSDSKCRLCTLRQTVSQVRGQLRARPIPTPLHIAIGVTVPEIEAWYLCGVDPHVSEAAWIVGQQCGKPPYDKRKLKLAAYGTEHPTLDVETQCAIDAATRLVQNFQGLQSCFPAGFGSLESDVRSW